ncbi:E3 ubiquitin-protein ligase MIB2-like isoform X1 [Leptotrombidium deliense]|uniref:E3 ubiquitin-protein ligase MIB2-like isoform X1 n=1 Tax=Leptotrombidium deliense TaxID=299467 RepID=A0A443SEC2_9ACAR|nr:E3 ubiquitin-protein ligase MIB2-like isoform X1 [Leptotrombidium deliense]
MDFHGRYLLESTFYGECNVVTRLLKSGVDVNVSDENGNCAIHKATQGEKVEILKLIVSHGANVNAKNKDQNTALHIAVSNLYTECVKILLQSGADVNIRNEEEETPLFLAIKHSNDSLVNLTTRGKLEKILELLLSSDKVDLSLFNKNGLNCLHYAVKLGNKLAFDKIVNKSPSLVSARDKCGYSNLHYAALYGRIVIMESLLQSLPKSSHMQSMSPLHLAIYCGHLSAAELLVSNGADCNAPDSLRNTPLHLLMKAFDLYVYEFDIKFIVRIRTMQIAEILLLFKQNDIPQIACFVLAAHMIKNGNANLFAENEFGETPMDYIPENIEAYFKIVKLFSKLYIDQLKNNEGQREIEILEMKQKLKDTTCPVCIENQKKIVFLCGHGLHQILRVKHSEV